MQCCSAVGEPRFRKTVKRRLPGIRERHAYGRTYCSYFGFGSLDGGTIPLARM